MSPLEIKFLTLLPVNRGLANAVSVSQVAAQLGISLRPAQEIKKALVENHGVNIGSSCGKRSGWYIPETETEIQATMKQYRSCVKSLCI